MLVVLGLLIIAAIIAGHGYAYWKGKLSGFRDHKAIYSDYDMQCDKIIKEALRLAKECNASHLYDHETIIKILHLFQGDIRKYKDANAVIWDVCELLKQRRESEGK